LPSYYRNAERLFIRAAGRFFHAPRLSEDIDERFRLRSVERALFSFRDAALPITMPPR